MLFTHRTPKGNLVCYFLEIWYAYGVQRHTRLCTTHSAIATASRVALAAVHNISAKSWCMTSLLNTDALNSTCDVGVKTSSEHPQHVIKVYFLGCESLGSLQLCTIVSGMMET